MNPRNLKEGDILLNRKTREYVQIKEITRDTVKHTTQWIVVSGGSEFISDAQTNIERKVLYWAKELQDYFYLDPMEARQ